MRIERGNGLEAGRVEVLLWKLTLRAVESVARAIRGLRLGLNPEFPDAGERDVVSGRAIPIMLFPCDWFTFLPAPSGHFALL
jgi:hypothetical protein